MTHHGPIGIFDSGVGGLSVLRHIAQQMPQEHLLYVADAGYAPYGGKPEEEIVARSLAIADHLLRQGAAKALVVACNTATAASIKALRATYPDVPVVGVEPGLKPAAALSNTGIVGVMATERTLASAKFKHLLEQISATSKATFLLQACVGLADQIEQGALHAAETRSMVESYLGPLLQQGADTIVLGCTHYPFVQPMIEEIAQGIAPSPVTIIDTGDAVARQLKRLLEQHSMQSDAGTEGALKAFTTGSKAMLADAFMSLLHLRPEIAVIDTHSAAHEAIPALAQMKSPT